MVTSETQLSYRQSTIRIINQPTTVTIAWESKLDGSVGHLQVSSANWADGEIARLVMQTIDRCVNQHERMKLKRLS
jgi:hypothetical protein